MFEFEDSVKFINIDTEYVKSLHDACSEVFYRDYNYSYKPYLGVLVCSGGKKYAIPLFPERGDSANLSHREELRTSTPLRCIKE